MRKQGCVPEHASWTVARLTAPVLAETERSIKHTGRFAQKRAMLAASPKLSNNAQTTRKLQAQSPARMRTQTVAASAGRSSMPASPGQKHACCAQGLCRITPRCPLQQPQQAYTTFTVQRNVQTYPPPKRSLYGLSSMAHEHAASCLSTASCPHFPVPLCTPLGLSDPSPRST